MKKNKPTTKPESKKTEPAKSAPADAAEATPLTFQEKVFAFLDAKNLGGLKRLYTPATPCVLLFLLAAIMVTRFIFGASRGEFHSDTTDTLMWAQASYDAKSLFNKDFTYACLLPFGGQLLMIPLIAMFGVTMKAHLIGMFIFFLLFAGTMFWMLKRLGWSTAWASISSAATLLLLSGSPKLREIFWGHIIYYSLCLFFAFVGFALVFHALKLIDHDAKQKKFYGICIGLFVWCMLTGTNQIESLTIFLLPLIGALVAERFFESSTYQSKLLKERNLILIGSSVLGTGAGYFLGNILTSGLIGGYEQAYSSFSDPDIWDDNLMVFFHHWTTLFGVDVRDAQKIMEGDGVIALLQIFFCIILIVAPIVLSILYPKLKNRGEKIFIWFHWLMTALVMMGFVFGKLSSANWRLSPILCTSILMTLILTKYAYENLKLRRVMAVLMIPTMLLCFLNLNTLRKLPNDYKQDQGLYALAENLESYNLTYGYATFWNANGLTVVSDSKVKVRNINITESGFSINDYQSQKSWYTNPPQEPYYFVLLSSGEYDMVKNNPSHPLLASNPVDTAISGGYHVLMYTSNLF